MTHDVSQTRHPAALWGLAGVALLFGFAAVRLGLRGIETIRGGLDPAHWVALAVLTALFLYGEGVRALSRKYVPHLLRRARRLATEAGPLLRVLAPLYLMSLVGAPLKNMVRAWTGTALIVAAVLVVRAFSEPWRGIVDFAVAVALAWGLLAVLRGILRVGEAPTGAHGADGGDEVG